MVGQSIDVIVDKVLQLELRVAAVFMVATLDPPSDDTISEKREYEYRIVDNGGCYHIEARRTYLRWYDSILGTPTWVMVTYPTYDPDKADQEYKVLCQPMRTV